MTAADYLAALEALAWSPGRLARVLGCDRTLTLQWASGRVAVPDVVGKWLQRLARHHRDDPPPTHWRTRSAA
jgi:hypothetical protein